MKPVLSWYRNPYLWWVVLIVATILLILTQHETLTRSFHSLMQAQSSYVVMAATISLVTCAIAALTYRLLAPKRLAYLPTVTVQAASMFVDRVVPVGLGAIGLNYHYLRKRRFNFAQASSMILANNILGSMGHGLVLAFVLLISGSAFDTDNLHLKLNKATMTLIVCVLLGFALLVIFRSKLGKSYSRLTLLAQQLAMYRKRPGHIFAALLNSMLLTLCNMSALYVCCYALGLTVPFLTVLFVYSVGVVVGAALPTPGGLVGTEAGIVGGLLAYGLAPTHALAVVVLFRLCNFWLPLILGVPALFVARQKKYI